MHFKNQLPSWRNWIARWTSNPKVASSSLAGGLGVVGEGTCSSPKTVFPSGQRGQTQV